jgi:hypothetical protein
VSPVRYKLGLYIPEDAILQYQKTFLRSRARSASKADILTAICEEIV